MLNLNRFLLLINFQKRKLFPIFLPLFLGGCVIGGTILVSDPRVDGSESSHLNDTGIIEVDGITVSVKPENYKPGIAGGGLIIPLIPLSLGEPVKREGLDFNVVVQFETSERSFTFHPNEVALTLNNKTYMPVAVIGPILKRQPALETQSALPGHNWYCDYNDKDFSVQGLSESLAVSTGCYVLKFSTITPDPEQHFSIKINGLIRDGRQIKIPMLYFSGKNHGMFTILG